MMNRENMFSRRTAMVGLGATFVGAVGALHGWEPGIGRPYAQAETVEIPFGAFVGEVSDGESGPTGILIAVLIDLGPVGLTSLRISVCNGSDLSAWLTADIAGSAFDMTTDDGLRVKGVIGAGGVMGTLRLPSGANRPFAATPAEGAEGLYYIAVTEDGTGIGSAERGLGLSYRPSSDRFEGVFLLPGGVGKPFSIPLQSVVLGGSEPPDEVESDGQIVYRAIVAERDDGLKIVGTFIDPRPPRSCRLVKIVTTLLSGAQSIEYVQMCS